MDTATRALTLLADNVPQNLVAAACGVTPARISQLIADPEFAAALAEKKYHKLQKFSSIDDKYAELEDSLLDKLKKVLPVMVKPRDIMDALSKVNAAKRRGAPDTGGSGGAQQIVQLTMPVQIIQKFVTNVNNQVVEVTDEQARKTALITASPFDLDRLAATATPEPKQLPTPTEVIPTGFGRSGKGKATNSGPVTVEDL